MSEIYNFPKDSVVNHSQIKEEINLKEGIPCPAIGTNLSSNILWVEMKSALTTEEQAILAQVVTEHVAIFSNEEGVQAVKIMEEPLYAKIDRTMEICSFELGVDGTSKAITFPFPVVILGGEFHCKTENIKDRCQLVVNPNGVVAALAADIAIGATTITVPAEYIGNFFRGYTLTLSNEVDTTENLGRVLSINTTTNTIEVQTAATMAWSAGSAIILEYFPIPHLFFDAVGLFDVGKNSNSGSYLEANMPIEFRYFHDNGVTKQVPISFRMDYYY